MVISGKFNIVSNKVVKYSRKESKNYYSLRSFWQSNTYIYTSVLQVEKETMVPRNTTICLMAPLDSGVAGETPNSIDFSSELLWLQSQKIKESNLSQMQIILKKHPAVIISLLYCFWDFAQSSPVWISHCIEIVTSLPMLCPQDKKPLSSLGTAIHLT